MFTSMLYLIICLYHFTEYVVTLEHKDLCVYIDCRGYIKTSAFLEDNFLLLLGLKYLADTYDENILGK